MQSAKEIYTSLPEPKRESVYEILQINLKRADRRTFVHRTIVVGEHSFGVNWTWGVEEVFRSIITEINEAYTDENLTGLLICYPSFFCHLVEGSEEALIEYISTLFKKYDNQLGSVKFLAPFHHIYKRAIDKWITVKGNPPRLLNKIEDDCDISETCHHALVCMKKLFKLCNLIKCYVPSSPTNMSLSGRSSTDDSQDIVSHSLLLPRSSASVATMSVGDVGGHSFETSKWRILLPEINVLTFFLQSPFLRDVREKISILDTIAPLDIPEDLTWPMAAENACDERMFEPRLDPAIDLPISKK
ncbi:uncharacterized protein LOC108739680 [Agrilus planipennis]|uniref:Uncharacterized protein LOC108739680 n=1 Tax=Agrilus planipennis TaxID=224129 RepID=A0A1W4WZC4_AGRPL|nr:uncharacterized protein LOC108739680 [Agrilus planipennis]